ncbi:MAG: bifunctional riboflavin kinase/FAD synthetase, partial [Alphaproteobacteria bacterium]|nr:bifunctional riboflavin kinase/FAD synthetase [Alphaproteobacteria bacterium]
HSSDTPAEARAAVVAIGNFDGVHLGHRAVIGTAGEIARRTARPHAVMTFEPHPRNFFRPDQPPFRLTPYRVKARHIAELGADFLFVLRFDAAFSRQSADDFVDRLLVAEMGISHVVVGEDFRFGRDRAGNAELLRAKGDAHGFGATAVAPVAGAAGETYSSSRIRDCLRAGDVRGAARNLGRFWEVEGRVESGDRRGRAIGFPTANLRLSDQLVPATGVYAVRVGVADGGRILWHDGVANFGNRPTFDDRGLILEVHLFDFDGDLYDRHMCVALIDYVRPERRFDGIDALAAQIAEDCAVARRRLGVAPVAGGRAEAGGMSGL